MYSKHEREQDLKLYLLLYPDAMTEWHMCYREWDTGGWYHHEYAEIAAIEDEDTKYHPCFKVNPEDEEFQYWEVIPEYSINAWQSYKLLEEMVKRGYMYQTASIQSGKAIIYYACFIGNGKLADGCRETNFIAIRDFAIQTLEKENHG